MGENEELSATARATLNQAKPSQEKRTSHSNFFCSGRQRRDPVRAKGSGLMTTTQAPSMSSQINTPSPHGLLKSLKRGKDVVAGTCGGIVVTLIGHPFDTLKVRLQAQSIANPVYNGVVDCFKQTV